MGPALLACAFAAVFAALPATEAGAQEKAPAGSADRGRQLFAELNCHSCHGTQGQGGGRGSEPPIPAGYPWAGFLGQLRKPRQDMPAYSQKWVSDQDVAHLYAYFSSLRKAPPAKDIPLLNR